jgi:hypothetical protein
VKTALEARPYGECIQQQTDTLISVVKEVVYTLTPKAKPSQYSKRWWNTDLMQMRQVHTYWRNRARSLRRRGTTIDYIEQQAEAAATEYHNAIRKQKATH